MRIQELDQQSKRSKNLKSNTNENESIPKETFKPSKIKDINYSKSNYNIKDVATKQAVETINCKMNALKPIQNQKHPPSNLSYLEQKGLKWLEEKTSNMEIMITKADKGGSILIVPHSLIENKIIEKIYNETIFKKLDKDPRQNFMISSIIIGKQKKPESL